MAPSDKPDQDGTEPGPAYPRHKEGFTIDDYRMIVRIGEGSFGEVWKAERGGFPVALKILNASINTEEAQRELKSLETLKKIHHKFLVHTENFWSDGDRLYIEMELADGGTLKERLKAYQGMGKDGIPEDELLKYFTEAAQALDYLHGHRPVFLHRDIKPANILLVRGCAKLADFGLLRQVTGDNTSTKTQGGTPVYMAPESVKEDKFSAATDLWSFAVTYAELRQGKLPFQAKTQFQIFQKVCQDPPELGEIFHPEERKVLLRALEKEPSHRFASCGDFVFELNRVVPWTPAVTVPELAPPSRPDRKPGSSKPKLLEPTVGAPAPAEQGRFRKKPVPTMEELALPAPEPASPNALTEGNDGGTVINEKARRSDQAAPANSAATAALPSPAPGTKAHPVLPAGAKTQSKTAASKSNALRILAAVLVVAVLSGVGIVVFQGIGGSNDRDKGSDRDKTGPAPTGLALEEVAAEVDKALRAEQIALARKTIEQNRKVLPDAGDALLARIDHKVKAIELLKTADELLKKKDYDAVLTQLAKAKTPFDFRTDADHKASILEAARDGRNGQLVETAKDAIRSKDPPRINESLDELARFRKENPRPDWQPDFQQLPLPSDLLKNAWDALRGDKVVPAEARRRLQEVQDYADPKQPEKFVLDPLYESNVAVLEALVKAHESSPRDWPAAGKELAAAARLAKLPPLSQNLWTALQSLEKNKKSFRFEDLDALPPAPDDPMTKQASAKLFALALGRLARADNCRWLPTAAQAKKCRAWLADYNGLDADLLAFKAECLVRSGANVDEINRVVLPASGDWYVAYVRALILGKTKSAAGADALAKIVKEDPKVRKERMEGAGAVLRAAVAALMPTGRTPRAFAAKEDASKALGWLAALLALEAAPTLDDLLDVTVAALKAQTKDADDMLKTLPARLDRLSAADKQAGFVGAGKAFRAELDAVNAEMLKDNPEKGVWDRAVHQGERASDFAQQIHGAGHMQEAAELHASAAAVRARGTFGKTKDGHAKYLVFEAALKVAQKKPADGFALPTVSAALESAKDFSKGDLAALIEAGEAALEAKLPPIAWSDSARATVMVRTADAKFALLFKKLEAGEKFTPADEYPKILDLYQKARPPQGKYSDKFAGELVFKIGRLHTLLGEYKNAYDELKIAKEKLATIQQPYPENARAEIMEARTQTDQLLNSKELKVFDK